MRIERIAAVTAGLMLVGGVFGTLAGFAVNVVWGIVDGDLFTATWQTTRLVLLLSLIFGGGPGAVLGPLAAWGLMRHVPLGLAVGGTTLGTLAGGVAGLIATGDPFVTMSCGVAGFGISAIALRIRYPRRAALPDTRSGGLPA